MDALGHAMDLHEQGHEGREWEGRGETFGLICLTLMESAAYMAAPGMGIGVSRAKPFLLVRVGW